MDITLEMETAAFLATPEADDDFAQELAAMDRILELVGGEFHRRIGHDRTRVSSLSYLNENRLLFEEHRATLITCCRTLRERRLADPELVLGLELMVGDLSHDQLVWFLARLPTPPTPPRRRRAAR
jgi:hypothetical protein